MAANDIVFGTDGFRAMIGDKFDFNNVRRIAQGLADYMAYKSMKGPDKKVAIGYDRRFLSEKFAEQFAAVLVKSGIPAEVSLTPISTPAISVLTEKKYVMGVVITASHNPYLYNGVKIKYKGRSAPPAMTAEIETHIPKNPVAEVKCNVEKKDFRKEYCSYIKSKYDLKKILSGIKGKIVVDFMNGTAAEVADEIFCGSKNIICLHANRDPLFTQVGAPEPVEKNLAELIKTVKDNKALMGIAVDGDGDRFALIDDRGNYLTPCQIAPLIVDYLVEHKKYSGKLVQAVSLGYLTKRIAAANKFLFEEVPVGFKFIAEKIASEDILFGAEESGGYAWKKNLPERDGFITALMLLEISAVKKKKVSELWAEIEKKYGKSVFLRQDYHLPKPVGNKHSFAVKIKKKLAKKILNYKVKEANTLDGLKVVLENDWWFLIRPSGTEPLLRVYAETDSQSNTRKLLETAYKASI